MHIWRIVRLPVRAIAPGGVSPRTMSRLGTVVPFMMSSKTSAETSAMALFTKRWSICLTTRTRPSTRNGSRVLCSWLPNHTVCSRKSVSHERARNDMRSTCPQGLKANSRLPCICLFMSSLFDVVEESCRSSMKLFKEAEAPCHSLPQNDSTPRGNT